MIFSVVVIVLVGVIAYFHWVQGLFSGLISAVCAVIAALMAMSYHEPLAALVFSTKMTDQGHAISLVVLFAVIYLVLRVVFDSLVPGNVRLPVLVDRAGGAVCGAIAGVFGVGILAIAAQSLPFGPAVLDYSRYRLTDMRDVKIQLANRGQLFDSAVNNELKSDRITPDDADKMILPVDEIVMKVTSAMSNGGSLEGDRTVASVHENYLDELFFTRLGTQVGARFVSVNTDRSEQAKAEKIFLLDELPQVDGELPMIRGKRDLKPQVKSDPGNVLLVVRVRFGAGGTDSDRNIRLAPAGVRLFAGGRNFLPIGTVQDHVLISNRPDDYLIVSSDQSVDFAFLVPRNDALKPAAAGAEGGPKLVDGAFVEVKRGARTPASGMSIGSATDFKNAEPATGVQRKKSLVLVPGGKAEE